MNKAELARHALELRAELGLDARTAFDPYQLAERYGIDVYQLSVLDCAPAAAHFTVPRSAALFGALILLGTGAVIVENDAQDRLRRRSTMAHEMAYWVREHPFACPLMAAERGCGIADRELETEASEVAGHLLIPTAGAVRLAHRRTTDQDVAELFDVSVKMARWRMDSSGARRIAERTASNRR